MPLINIRGTHVAKYRHFKTLLNHNHTALNAIATMEQLYYSGRPFGMSLIRTAYEELLEAVFGVIYALKAVSGREYTNLERVAEEIDIAISRNLKSEVIYTTRDLVLPFEKITSDSKKIVGGKAANLALIKNNLGLQVPDGFAVTAYAFQRVIEGNQLSEPVARELSKISLDNLEEAEAICGRIQAMVMDAAIPQDVEEAIVKAYEALEEKTSKGVRIAMRSSAIGEDTEATFAGQYTTVLNVDRKQIIDAYKTVLASKYSAKAVSYRIRYGLADRETPMCVAGVVMINPQASGVVYTRNSFSNGDNTIKVTSLLGLAEQLVDGSAFSDVFTVDRKSLTIIRRDINRKEYRLVSLDSGGTALEAMTEAEKEMPSLDDDTIVSICQYGLILEKFFGSPQDIEWAKDKKGGLFILQSRPLSLPDVSSDYDNEDIRKNLEGYPVLISNGETASPGIATGKVFILRQMEDIDSIGQDVILVAKTASPDYSKVIGKIRGIITDIGSVASHLSSVAREFGIPAIVDTRDATSRLVHGEMITMSADTVTVYKGLIDVLMKDIRPVKKLIFESPVHRKTRVILDRISPLTLIDPADAAFSPEGCKTLHDIIRFTHETGMKAMFGITDEAEEIRSVELAAKIPLTLRLIDLGGGLSKGLTTCHTVTPEHIESVPMKAVWKGFTHPGISWSETIAVDTKKLLTLFAVSATTEASETVGGTSYAIISGEYMNLSAKFGYHFATIDTLCSENSNQNYISLQFAGGAGNYYGKSLRISFLGGVLRKLGFQTSLKGDLIDASIVGYDKTSTENSLDLLGRLLASSRLLDMSLSGQHEIELLIDAFFREDYDFLSQKRDDQLHDFYTHGGYWKRVLKDGHIYCLQDGSKAGFSISSGVAGVMGKLVGQALQDFLDNIEAYYYFPLAVAKDSEITDGIVSVRVQPISGHIDRAGGIVFGMQNVSNYFVLRINALEENVILFEFVNGKRVQRALAKEKIVSNSWYSLSVEIRGSSIKGYLNDRLVLEYAAEKALKGFVGLWTKADSVTCFDELTIQTGTHKQIIEFELSMKVAYRTDKGMKRALNQDAILVDRERGLCFLADGVGGNHKAGEVASAVAVKEAYAYLRERVKQSLHQTIIPKLLLEAIDHVHSVLRGISKSDEKFQGMGTTLVIMLLKDRTAYISHVGDSRVYIIRRRIRQVTEDHTFQNYLDHNIMIRDLFFRKEARILMQAVGISGELSPESIQVELKSGALVLLCSDGLTDMLDDKEILEIVHGNSFDVEKSADALIEAANRKGGKDNISVILVST